MQRYIENPKLKLHNEAAVTMGLGPKTTTRRRSSISPSCMVPAAPRSHHSWGCPRSGSRYATAAKLEVAGYEAQAIIDLHFEKLPWVKKLQELAKYGRRDRGLR